MRKYTIDLHEVVSMKRGIVKEILPNYFISWIGYAFAYNSKTYTYLAADRAIAVEETPDEILDKIRQSAELSRALYEYDHTCPEYTDEYWVHNILNYADNFRVFNDWEKSVLINLELIKYAEPISKFQTKLVIGKKKWSMIIHLPIRMLNLPRNKIRLPHVK